MKALSKETETYKKLLTTLLADQGKFAVIHGDKLIGVYTAYEDAMKIGYERCGIDSPFLVKKISSEENISHFSRDLNTSCLA